MKRNSTRAGQTRFRTATLLRLFWAGTALTVLALAGCGGDGNPIGPPPQQTAYVSGAAYLDRDRNGSLDPGEALSGLIIRFTPQTTGAALAETRTDPQGRYSVDLVPGTYDVSLPSAADSVYFPGISGFIVSSDVARVLDVEARYVRKEGNYTVAAETKVVAQAAASTTQLMADGSTVVVPTGATGSGAPSVGDILVSDSTAANPMGFLRRVTGQLSDSAGLERFSTTGASLEDAIVEGEISYDQVLTGAPARFIPNIPGAAPVALRSTANGYNLVLNGVPVFDYDGNSSTTSDQIRLTGSLSLASVEPVIDEKIEDGETTRSRWGVRFSNDISLDLSWGTVPVSFGKEYLLGRVPFPTIVIQAGLIPVSVTPVLKVYAGASGEIHLGVSAGFDANVAFSGGFEFGGGSAQPWGQIDKNITVHPVTISAGGSAEAHVRTPFTFLIYGVAGPYVEIRAGGDISADVAANPWWSLGLDVALDAGFKPNGALKILRLPEIDVSVLNRRYPIVSAPGPFGGGNHTLSVGGTGNGSGTVLSNPSGINCSISAGNSCVSSFHDGTTVTLTASPSAGNQFTGWSGDGSGSGLTRTIQMDQDRSVVAGFAEKSWTLSVDASGDGSGSVTSNPAGITCTITDGNESGACQHSFADGANVTLTASWANGNTFQGWSGDGTGSGATRSVTMTQNRSVTAAFGAGTSSGSGSKLLNNASFDGSLAGWVVEDLATTASRTPGSCSWSSEHGGSAECQVAGAPGTVFLSQPTLRQISPGDVVTVHVYSSDFGNFGGWSVVLGEGTSAAFNLCSLTDYVNPSNRVAGNYTCTWTADRTVPAGTKLTLHVVVWPGSGTAWFEDVGYAAGQGGTQPETTHLLTVTAAGSGNGVVTSSPAGIDCVMSAGHGGGSCAFRFNHGVGVTLTAHPDSESTFGGWSGAGSGSSTRTVSMTGDQTVSASFETTVPVDSLGGLGSVLRNQNGSAAPAAGVRQVLYTDPIRTLRGSNPAAFNDVPAGDYLLEGYSTGTFFGEEFWTSRKVTVTAGQTTSVTLTRNYPYAEQVVFKNDATGEVLGPGQSVDAGTRVRAEITVRNDVPGTPLNSSVRLLVDRDRSAPYDGGWTMSPERVGGSGGTNTFSVAFTPGAGGQYYFALEVKTTLANGNTTRTDAWDWTRTVKFTEPQTGGVGSVLRKQNGSKAPAAGVRQVLYTNPVRTVRGSNPAAFNDVPAGDYLLEGYSTGTFFGEEFWTSQTVTVTAGQTKSVTLTRKYPYASRVVVKNDATGATLSPGQTVPAGTRLRAEVTVRNDVPGTTLNSSVRVLFDRNRSASYDGNETSSWAHVSGGGGTQTYRVRFTPSASGQYYFALEVMTTLANGNTTRTDSWDWTQTAKIAEPAPTTGDLVSTLRNVNGSEPSSGTRQLLYTNPLRTVRGSNPAVFNGVPAGDYLLEGYATGTFFGEEFWTSRTVTITAGRTASVTLTRNYPYASRVVIKNDVTSAVVSPGQTVSTGTRLRAEVTIRNDVPGTTLNNSVRMLFDRNRAASYDGDEESTWAHTSGNGGTQTLRVRFTPSASGQYYFALEVMTTLANGNTTRTDSWNWTQTFVAR